MWFQDIIPAALGFTSAWSGGFRRNSMSLGHGHHKPIDFYERNLKTISDIYNLTVFPNNLPIIETGSTAVPAGLFALNATGRVSPLGNFTGFNDSIEYFFALALVPSPPAYAVFTSAKVVEFSSSCPEVASSVAYLETRVDNTNLSTNGQFLSTLKEIAFWRFDDTGAVTAYDAWIPNLADWQFYAEGRLNLSNPFVQSAEIDYLCEVVMERCTGANQQYTDVNECVQVLSTKPFGTYDEVWGDNVVCRTVHIILTLVRPDVHCPHVGPTGGAKCVNVDYNDVYFDDPALWDMPEGDTFICPSKKCHH